MKLNIKKTFGDLDYKRNALEAFGFYLLHLAVGVLFVLLVTIILSTVFNLYPPTVSQVAIMAGSAFAFVYSVALTLLLTKKKHIKGNERIIFVVLTAIASLAGLIGGLVLPTLLTTQDRKIIG